MEEIAQITRNAEDVKGYEGLYKVTKHGVVYSLPKKGRKLKIMKAVDNMPAGYLRVSLTRNGRTKLCYIHRLVAEAYIINPGSKPMVNHRNGIKTDNNVDNLEWVTCIENHIHGFELGLYPHYKIHPSQKNEVYDMVAQGVPVIKVAEIYGMKPGGVYSLVKRYKEAELRMAA